MAEHSGKKFGRREFMGTAAAAAAGFMIIKPELVRGTSANSALRVGLLGCGGRGRADTKYLIQTGKARLVALADLFQDKLDAAKSYFDSFQRSKGYAPIERSLMFRGPEAYRADRELQGRGRYRDHHDSVFPPAASGGGSDRRQARLL